MTLNWRALAPYRPLNPSDIGSGKLYIERPNVGSADVARLIDSGKHKDIALFGPAGSGKSTELVALHSKLSTNGAVTSVLIQIDHSDNFRKLTTTDSILEEIGKRLIEQLAPSLDVSYAAPAKAQRHPIADSDDGVTKARDSLRSLCIEVRTVAGQKPLVVLLDGLEKEETCALQVLLDLSQIPEAVFVAVVPTTIGVDASTGETHNLTPGVLVELPATQSGLSKLSDKMDLLPVEPVLVSQSLQERFGLEGAAERGIDFLLQIARRRLAGVDGPLEDPLEQVMRKSALLSGGLTRTFLQLLQDAAVNAEMTERDIPSEEDLNQAAADQTSMLVRLLLDGDREALTASHGTTCESMEPDRRMRLLSHGLLLQYQSAGGVMLVAPLLRDVPGLPKGALDG